MKRRLTIRASLVFIALLGGIFAVIRWNDPAVRYRRLHDSESLRTVLSDRIKGGDSIEEVRGILGPSRRNTDPGLRRAAIRFARLTPTDFPGGVEDRDEFHAYAEGAGFAVNLQFRDGRLVNFNPKTFEGPNPSASASR